MSVQVVNYLRLHVVQCTTVYIYIISVNRLITLDLIFTCTIGKNGYHLICYIQFPVSNDMGLVIKKTYLYTAVQIYTEWTVTSTFNW